MALLHDQSVARHSEAPRRALGLLASARAAPPGAYSGTVAQQFDDATARRILTVIMDPEARPAD